MTYQHKKDYYSRKKCEKDDMYKYSLVKMMLRQEEVVFTLKKNKINFPYIQSGNYCEAE